MVEKNHTSSLGASEAPTLTALVLAGRAGHHDPVAAATGATHKALAPLRGLPLVLHVIRSLRATACVGRIVVSIDEPAPLTAIAELRELVERGSLELRRAGASPAASVLDCLEDRSHAGPLLVTTADHPLLSAEMVEHFVSGASSSASDLVVAVVTASLVRARYPESPRTFIPLRGGSVTGANLFAFLTPRSARAAAFWARAEGIRKQPWRLATLFGPMTLLLFALRRLDLDAALARASARMGVRIHAVSMPFPECAIDVDRPVDLALAARILAAREATESQPDLPSSLRGAT
jgi:GTP:adenosylcobinamide-phosphate guanylyltransferase